MLSAIRRDLHYPVPVYFSCINSHVFPLLLLLAGILVCIPHTRPPPTSGFATFCSLGLTHYLYLPSFICYLLSQIVFTEIILFCPPIDQFSLKHACIELCIFTWGFSPWLADDHLLSITWCFLCACTHLFLSVCPHFFFWYGHRSYWIRVYSNSLILR